MPDLREALRHPLLMDGAMGTQIQRRGLTEGACFERCNLEHPDWVSDVHHAYVRSGAECLLTHTFQANPFALARHGQAPMLEAILERACRLARAAAGPGRFVLADVGPMERFDGDAFRRVLAGFHDVDGVLLETFSSPEAADAARWAGETRLPVLLSLSYGPGLCTHSDHPPEWFAEQAGGWGVAALGVNCGRDIDMAETAEIVRRYRQATDLPLFARPNAGTPVRDGGEWIYTRSPEDMAGRLAEVIEVGATWVGGCCGTTPEHIAAFRTVLDAVRSKRTRRQRAPGG
jgi:5-methyltetrahydrofolate--homocysteine methyltransferase